MIATLRLWLMLGIMLPITLVLMPIQFVAVKLDLKLARWLPVYWHKTLCWMIGLQIKPIGKVNDKRPLMLVANHLSWSDIIILGSIAPVCFIAKQEVSTTLFAGWLAKLQRTIFVVREQKRKSGDQAREVADRLLAGDVVVLFAEGTTGDGNYILEFKSTLFAAAQFALAHEDIDEIAIQPVSIAYTHLQGVRLARRQRARASWPGDLELAPHATGFMKESSWDVDVSFGEPVIYDGSQKRRELARYCETTIKCLYHKSVYGRDNCTNQRA
jgi:1-acyl-sn-glycerol-3-phosphate acyltransferase